MPTLRVPSERRAAIYCRLSQDREGKTTAVDRQEVDSRTVAERLGWEVVACFVDNDVSASGLRPRPAYRALVDAIRSGSVNAIVCWNIDRLYRRLEDLEELVQLAESMDIKVEVVTSGAIDLNSVSGRLMARTLGVFARAETERLAERVVRGKQDAATRGEYSGGPAPFGYKYIAPSYRIEGRGSLEIDLAQAELVRGAATAILAGASLRGLAIELNTAGHVTARGNVWTGSALRKVLLAPVIAGLRSSHGLIIAKGNWEPIMDETMWRGVGAVLTEPSRRTSQNRARKYLGSGIFECGVCGGPLIANATAGGSKKTPRPVYRCRPSSDSGSAHVFRDLVSLDAYVESHVIARLARPDAARAFTIPGGQSSNDLLVAERTAIVARQAELGRMFGKGEIEAVGFAASSSTMSVRVSEIDAAIASAAVIPAIGGLLSLDFQAVAAKWDQIGLDRRRAVVAHLLIVRVLPSRRKGRLPAAMGGIDPDGVELEWRA